MKKQLWSCTGPLPIRRKGSCSDYAFDLAGAGNMAAAAEIMAAAFVVAGVALIARS